jgi:hypothetical protein
MFVVSKQRGPTMSLTRDGQSIMCDGLGCDAMARVPVALRPMLARNAGQPPENVSGWLFVHSGSGRRHYCSRCHNRYFESLSDFSRLAPVAESALLAAVADDAPG